MNILVVDDQIDFHHLLSTYLEEEKDWKVFTALHGKAALEVLAQQKIDIIISDVYMPIMDGAKLYREVRNHPQYANIPFIFISAYDDPQTLSVMRFSLNDAFVLKQNLYAEIKGWIRYFMIPIAERPPKHLSVVQREKSFSSRRSYEWSERLGAERSRVPVL